MDIELSKEDLDFEAEVRGFLKENAYTGGDAEAWRMNWFEKAREVSQRKFGLGLPGNSAERAKRGRFLQQRGFSWDQIQSI